jgi:uncharacterized YigZ family protein
VKLYPYYLVKLQVAMKPAYVPGKEIRTEIIVVNSRFIASLSPAFSVEQARSYINLIKSEFRDASHNVPAFVIGHGQSVTAHCNDDGEPSGTAGRPVLSVLQGSGLGDAVIVVTRYFGGTKLGRGGLVRAYSDVAREAIKILPLAEKVVTHTIMFSVPYNLYEPVKLLLEKYQSQILDETFTVDVTITVKFRTEDLHRFRSQISELSNGSVDVILIDTQKDTILPIPPKNNDSEILTR